MKNKTDIKNNAKWYSAGWDDASKEKIGNILNIIEKEKEKIFNGDFYDIKSTGDYETLMRIQEEIKKLKPSTNK